MTSAGVTNIVMSSVLCSRGSTSAPPAVLGLRPVEAVTMLPDLLVPPQEHVHEVVAPGELQRLSVGFERLDHGVRQPVPAACVLHELGDEAVRGSALLRCLLLEPGDERRGYPEADDRLDARIAGDGIVDDWLLRTWHSLEYARL